MSDQATKIVSVIRSKSDAEAATLLSKLLTAARDRGLKEAGGAKPTLLDNKIPNVPFINFGDENGLRDAVREVDGKGDITVSADVVARLLAEACRLRGSPADPRDPYHEVPPAPGVGRRPGFAVATSHVACRVWGQASMKERIDVATTLIEGSDHVIAPAGKG